MQPSKKAQKSISIVGGGMTGITAAIRLAQSGLFKVTLFEAANQIGGLSSYYQWEDVIWDRFYHVILSTDIAMLRFIQELGLENQLFWRDTRTGFFGSNRLVSMSSTMDFLRFPFMSLWQKFRMGLGIIYSSRIKSSTKLDRIYAQEWLIRIFGRRVYENIWEPLLRSKLGEARERTSAAFIWATINRLYGARQNSGSSKREQMGHVLGGYHTILSAAEKKLAQLGVELRKGMPVKRIRRHDTKISQPTRDKQSLRGKSLFSLHTDNQEYIFDNVLLTVDCPGILELLRADVEQNHSYWRSIEDVDYLGVICVFLVLKRQLSPYYVINLLDKDLPFTGVIEATNVVSPVELGDRHIVYLPKYIIREDPVKKESDEEIISLFINKLMKVFPRLDYKDVLHSKVFRSECVQPIQELNYLDRSNNHRTPIQGLYIANTSMIYNSTLNNNAAISLASNAVSTIIKDGTRSGQNH